MLTIINNPTSETPSHERLVRVDAVVDDGCTVTATCALMTDEVWPPLPLATPSGLPIYHQIPVQHLLAYQTGRNDWSQVRMEAR